MRSLTVRLCACLCLATAVLATVAAAAQERTPLKVGVVLPLTGAYQKFGEIQKNAFLMGTEEINSRGGVNGRPIELLIEDDKSRIDVGRSAAEKLILRDNVIVLTGGYSSDVTFAMAAVAQSRKVPLLVMSGAADEITELSADYVFRLCQPVSEFERPLVTFLQQVVKPGRVAILYEETLFGASASRAFARQAFESDWKIVLNEGYDAGTRDFEPLLGKARAADPDVVYMISNDVEDAALLVRQAKGLDFKPKVLAGVAAAFTLHEFRRLAGDGAENVYSLTLWTPQVPYPGAKEYHSNFMKQFGSETDYHGAQAYASIYVVADALKRAKNLTPKEVREALARTSMMTAFGPVRFVSYGRKTQQNSLPSYLAQWQKGVLETVWPKLVATRAYVYSE